MINPQMDLLFLYGAHNNVISLRKRILMDISHVPDTMLRELEISKYLRRYLISEERTKRPQKIRGINKEAKSLRQHIKRRMALQQNTFCCHLVLIVKCLLCLLTKLVSQATQISICTNYRVVTNNEVSKRTTGKSLMRCVYVYYKPTKQPQVLHLRRSKHLCLLPRAKKQWDFYSYLDYFPIMLQTL